MLLIKCRTCRKVLRLSGGDFAQLAGQRIKCSCGSDVLIPVLARAPIVKWRTLLISLIAGSVIAGGLIGGWAYYNYRSGINENTRYAEFMALKRHADENARQDKAEEAASNYAKVIEASRLIRSSPEIEQMVTAAEEQRERWERKALQQKRERQKVEAQAAAVRARVEAEFHEEQTRVQQLAEQERREKEAVAARQRQDEQSSQVEKLKRPDVEANRRADEGLILRPDQIVAKYEGSVALIKSAGGSGTGFVVAPNRIATNYHVIKAMPLSGIEVLFPSDRDANKKYKVDQVVYLDRQCDLAVVEVHCNKPPVAIAEAYDFVKGQTITVIGNPGVGDEMILENAVSVGVMSTQTLIKRRPFYQLSIGINPGNSGGPVFDSHGRVIGVVTLKATKQESIAFCIPFRQLQSGLASAARQTAQQISQSTHEHRTEALVQELYSAGQMYALTMELYAQCMRTAVNDGLTPSRGLAIATEKMEPILSKAEKTLIGNIGADVSAVYGDRQIDSGTRQAITDLWTTYRELKGYVDNPQGSYTTYSQKGRDLADKLKHNGEALNRRLGIELDDASDEGR
jgi:S1-C subfamily serine protease